MITTTKRECSFCGKEYDIFAFKGGYVCENCLQYIREQYLPDSITRSVKSQSVL